MYHQNQFSMANEQNYSGNKDNNANPADRQRSDINPHTRSQEASEKHDSDNDRKGRNIDIDLENQENKIEGRKQQTTPQNSGEEIRERFNRKEQQPKSNSRKQENS